MNDPMTVMHHSTLALVAFFFGGCVGIYGFRTFLRDKPIQAVLMLIWIAMFIFLYG